MNIELEQELSIRNNLKEPHFSYLEDSISNRERVANLIISKNGNEILLIDSYGFLFDSVFAGITEKQIEYIAKNAPRDYKENILKILQDQEMMKGVFEIAKSMDDDLGRGSTRNQERVKNIIQYIKDNRIAFGF